MSNLLDALKDARIAILFRLLEEGENKPNYAEITALKREDESIAILIQRYKENDWKKPPEKQVGQVEEQPTRSEEDNSDGESV